MVSIARVASVGIAAAVSAVAVHPAKHPSPEDSKIPGEYIVVFKEGTASSAWNDHAGVLERSGAKIIETYDISREFRGYAFKTFYSLNATGLLQAQSLALEIGSRDDVAYVEQDQYMYTQHSIGAPTCDFQKEATWGLSRVSSLEPGTTDYHYPGSSCEGMTAYVIDSGVRQDHDEFEGRIDYDARYDPYYEENTEYAGDDNGHGTHVAGTIAGKTYGICKKAKIAPIKVLSASGSGQNSIVIEGVERSCKGSAKELKKRTANMSLGGGLSQALNDAVAACVDKGMAFVVAAGNDNLNACTSSPASEETAITVMASDRDDKFAVFSNHGACADIIAPGVGITSSWNTGPQDYMTISGTSMASPHVAGVYLLLQSLHPDYTPVQVRDKLLDISKPDKIADIPLRAVRTTTNKLLYSDCIDDF